MPTLSQKLAAFLEKEAEKPYKYRAPSRLPKFQAFLEWIEKTVDEMTGEWPRTWIEKFSEKYQRLEDLVDSLMVSDCSSEETTWLRLGLISRDVRDPCDPKDLDGDDVDEPIMKAKIQEIMDKFRSRGQKAVKEVLLELKAREFERMTPEDYHGALKRGKRARLLSDGEDDFQEGSFDREHSLKPWNRLFQTESPRIAHIRRQEFLNSLNDDLTSELAAFASASGSFCVKRMPPDRMAMMVAATEFFLDYVEGQNYIYLPMTTAHSQATTYTASVPDESLDGPKKSVADRLDSLANALSEELDYYGLAKMKVHGSFNTLELIKILKGYRRFVEPILEAYDKSVEDRRSSIASNGDGSSSLLSATNNLAI